MNPVEGLLYGFSVCLAPANLLAALAGALLGTLVGVLPGLGPIGAMALLLPFSVGLRPETALILLAGLFYGAMYGGSTTSILVNVPGEAASVVTSLEGYKMAKRGRAGAALAVAAVGSFVAGTVGVVGLMVFAPVLAEFALSFGPPEFFSLALLGLFALARISAGSLWKSVVTVSIGLVLGTVGMDYFSGRNRFTFGIVQLGQGIELVPVVMGLFGLAEVLLVAERAGGLPQVIGVGLRELLPTLAEWRRAAPAILRGGGMGFALGLIPGPTAVISTFVSYNVERRVARHPEEFGNGAIEGVAGPEAANNAATSAQMIPLLALGIPFSPVTALLLAALMMQGVRPGPLLMQEHPEIFWGLVASMYVGNLALLVLNLPLVGVWVSFLRIPQSTLLGLITLFILIGCYSVNNSTLDLVVVVASGIVGYFLRKLDFDVMPTVLALVLGPFIEKNLRQSLYASRGDLTVFLERPFSAVMLAALLLVLVAPTVWRVLSARRRLQTIPSGGNPNI